MLFNALLFGKSLLYKEKKNRFIIINYKRWEILSTTPSPLQSWSVGSYPKHLIPLLVAASIAPPVAASITPTVAASITPVAASIAPMAASITPMEPAPWASTRSQPMVFPHKPLCELLSPIYQMTLLFRCSGITKSTVFSLSNGTSIPTHSVRSGGQTELSYSLMMWLVEHPQNLKRVNALLHQVLKIGTEPLQSTFHWWTFMRDRLLIHLCLAIIGKPPLLYGEIELAETGSGLTCR